MEDQPQEALDEPGARLLKIGEFAKLAGTNLRTLRYYEELGLLEPAERSQGGFRFYRSTDINRLLMIRELQELGLPLERIGELLDTRDVGLERDERMQRIRAALDEQDRLLSERMTALQEQRVRLRVARIKLDECFGCDHTPRADNNRCEPCQVCGLALPRDLSALF